MYVKIIMFFSILFSLYVLLKLYRLKNGFSCLKPVLIVFDFIMVFPLLLELFLGIPHIPKDVYNNYYLALKNNTVTIIFCTFVLLMQLAFLIEIRYERSKSMGNYSIFKDEISEFFKKISNNRYRKIIIILTYFPFIILLLAIALSPDPAFFFKLQSVFSSISPEISDYAGTIVNPIVYSLMVATVINKIMDDRGNILFLISRILFVFLIMIGIHKRTFMMITIGAIIIVDMVKGGKIFPKYLPAIAFIVFYYIYYAIATKKIAFNGDWYYLINEYFFRSMHMRFTIYASLYSENVHILDYPGQSILFSLFYFVPRAIWASKPRPYIEYYMRGLLNLSSLSKFSYAMPAGYFPEFISNFGILIGILVGIIFTIFFIRYFNNCEPITKMLGLILLTILEIYYYDNNMKIGIAILIILLVKEKLKIVNGVLYIKRGKVK